MKKHAALLLACLLGAWGAAQAAIPIYGYIVKNRYPHDPQAFTQGLFFKDGFLYESTGRPGQSSVRKVELATGKVLQKTDLAPELFGEGIAEVGNDIVGLTWTSQVGHVFDLKSFRLKRKFSYVGEGWGLASGAGKVFMSDGSAFIRVLDHALKEQRRFEVTADGKPLARLNELEWVDGELFANVWGEDIIARIDPASGKVVGWIDLRPMFPANLRGTASPDAVLNGIAWDGKQRRLFVTGKLWPALFEIELVRISR